MTHRYFFIVPVLTVLFLSQGCAKNVVHLSYPEATKSSLAAPASRRTVYVADFANKRTRGDIGLRKNGTPILPRTSVERWIAAGLGEELRRAGYAVILVETIADALPHSPDYIITGDLEEVWMTEAFLARYAATIRADIIVYDGWGQRVTSSSYTSTFSRVGLPFGEVPQSLLDDALFEMLQPAVRLLSRSMQ